MAELASEALGAKASRSNVDRVRSSLHAAAADTEVSAAIERGRLTEDHEPIGLGPQGVPTAAVEEDPRREQPDKQARAAARARVREARNAERDARRKLEAARRTLQRRQTEAGRAKEALGVAQTELEEAERGVQQAATRLAEAESETGA
jgi:hypothetical protein